MRIVKFIIENYKALKGKNEFEPKGSSFMLIGANNEGKTSAGRAIMDVLTKKVPSKAITDGEKEGFVEYTFDNGQKLFAKFSQNGTNKLELISEDGLKINTPKELIQKLTGAGMNFNIDDFLSMAPKPRRELLEKIVGLDLSELNEAEAKAFEERKVLNATVKVLEAQIKPFDEKLAKLEVIDTKEALVKLQEMTELNASVARVKEGISVRETKVDELSKQLQVLQSEIEKGKEWLTENKGFSDDQIQELETTIEKADDIRKAKEGMKGKEELEKAKSEALIMDETIKSIRDNKEKKIKSAKLPAEGLTFEEDELLLDGLPFDSNQISASRKLIAAIQIAASMLGEIKYLHFDGSALDKNSADKILTWAEKNDLQLCLERPLWEGGDGVKMEIVEPIEKKEKVVEKKEVVAEKKEEKKEPVIVAKVKGVPW